MCAPIVLTGISMLSQAYSAYSTNAQITRQANVGAQNAVAEATFKYNQLVEREYEDTIARMQQVTQRGREGMRDRGRLTAELADQAGESNTLAQRIAIASEIQEQEDIGAIKTEQDFMVAQGQFERLGIDLSTKARLAESKALAATRIPPWLTALQMGVSGYSTWTSMNPRRPAASVSRRTPQAGGAPSAPQQQQPQPDVDFGRMMGIGGRAGMRGGY